MKVAVVGPADLGPLRAEVDAGDALPGGMGAGVVTSLVRALLEAGHTVTLVTLDRDVADRVEAAGERLRVLVGPYRPAHRARDAFAVERRAVAALVADADADVVHAHWTYEFALGALAARRAPTLVTAHDWAPVVLRHDTNPYRAVRLGMAVAALRAAPAVTAVSPYLARLVAKWARGEVAVVPNGMDDAIAPAPHAPPAGEPLVVAVNHGVDRRKNTSTLLAAFALIRRRLPGARLHLAGAGHEPGGPAEAWARRRGLTAGVTFAGPLDRPDVLALIRRADLFAHPSREESFGLVLLEAMAAGVPVVAGARSGAVPWVLDGGRAGALADISSPVRLADAVVDVLADPAAHQRLARAGLERAGTFTAARMAAGYTARYADLLRAAPTGV